MAERGLGGAQHLFTQAAAMRVHKSKGDVVADRTDIAAMIGDALELGHHRPQIKRARRRAGRHCALGRLGEGKRACDRAIARQPAGETARISRRLARHQGFGAFVGIAKAFFEAHHGFAVAVKAKGAGLDDAGMHRSHGNLMNPFPFHRQKLILRRRPRLGRPRQAGLGMRLRPLAVIQPWPDVCQPIRREAEKILDRALKPDRPGTYARQRGKMPIRGVKRRDGQGFRRTLVKRHMHQAAIAPKPQQRPVDRRQMRDELEALRPIEAVTRPGMLRHPFAAREEGNKGGGEMIHSRL